MSSRRHEKCVIQRSTDLFFFTRGGIVKATDDVSFNLERRDAGIVSRSGCGKSITALSVMRLVHDPPRRSSVGGTDRWWICTKLDEDEMRNIRGNINSDLPGADDVPQSSANHWAPDQRGLDLHQMSKQEAWNRSIEMLGFVKIPNLNNALRNTPTNFPAAAPAIDDPPMALSAIEDFDCRRADDGARRHHSSAVRSDRRAEGEARDRGDLDYTISVLWREPRNGSS